MPIDSPGDLERWLDAAGELNAAVGQESAKRYVAMTCQTDDPDREAAYLSFIRDIEPKLKPFQNEVRNRYLDSPFRAQLPADRYRVFNRALENRRALYREANIARETRLAELEQQYQKTMGAMTVTFQGQERTLAQMAPFLEETDRSLRQSAWELSANRRLQDKDALDDLFDAMLVLRGEIAHEAGFDSYVDFAFRQRERFDYGVADALKFHTAVETGRRAAGAEDPGRAPGGARGSPRCAPGIPPSIPWAGRRSSRLATFPGSPREPRRSFARSIRSSGPSSPSSAPRGYSTWPTARARPPAAIRRPSRTIACRSSS